MTTCNQCGRSLPAFALIEGRCAPCNAAAPVTHRVGTVAGRHPMPVEIYLAQWVEPGQAAYDATYAETIRRFAGGRVPSEDTVEVYYTGLTEATLGVVDALAALAIRAQVEEWTLPTITLMRYDSAAGVYQPLRRGPVPSSPLTTADYLALSDVMPFGDSD